MGSDPGREGAPRASTRSTPSAMNEKPAPTGASGLTSLHEGLLIAFDAMRANAIRSSLTILGVAVGVSVVVALAAIEVIHQLLCPFCARG